MDGASSRAQVTAKIIILGLILVGVIYPFVSVLSTSWPASGTSTRAAAWCSAAASVMDSCVDFQGGVITAHPGRSGITLIGTLVSLVITLGWPMA